MEHIIHGPGIYSYQLSEEDQAKVNSLLHDANLNKHAWIESVTMNGQKNYRMSDSFHVTRMAQTTLPQFSNHDRVLYTLFNQAVTLYQSNFNLRVQNDEGYEILHYAPGGQYKKHIDAGGLHFGRIVSGLLYINDDYKGGHLEFTLLKITVQPRKGTILLFPSNYMYEHIAHPITEGDKYAIVTFFHPLDEYMVNPKPTSTAPTPTPAKRYSNGAVNL